MTPVIDSQWADKVVTVLGPVEPDELGVTMVHEHILCDWTSLLREPEAASQKVLYYAPVDLTTLGDVRWYPWVSLDNYRMWNVELAIVELDQYRLAGGRSIVDVTPFGGGRDAEALQRISRETGLHIVLGCGYYIDAAHPSDMECRDADQIAAEIIGEFAEGVGDSGVRPGIIGEIGTSSPITANEERSLRGAARAQRQTGAALSVHLYPWGKEGHKVLDVLEEEGVDPRRVILDHLFATIDDLAYHRSLAKRGAYLGYDLFGFDHSLIDAGRWPPSDREVALAIRELIEEGYLSQCLLSQDIGVKLRLTAYGGWGYAHLLKHVVPVLHHVGIGPDQVATMLVDNPRALLPLRP